MNLNILKKIFIFYTCFLFYGMDSLLQANEFIAIEPVIYLNQDIGNISVSPDNHYLLISSASNTVSLRDLKTGKEIWRQYLDHRNQVFFSTDGESVFVANDNEVVQLGIKTGRIITRFKGSLSSIKVVAISPDNNLLFVASAKKAEMWDVPAEKILFKKLGSDFYDYSINERVMFSPDSSIFLLKDKDKTSVFDARKGNLLWKPDGKGEAWEFIDKDHMVMSGWATLNLRNPRNGKEISWSKAPNHMLRLKYYAKANVLLAETYGDVFLFDGSSLKLLKSFPLGNSDIDGHCYKRKYAAEISPDGKSLSIANNKKELWIYSLGDKIVGKKVDEKICIRDMAFTQSGNILITGEMNTIKLWNVSTGTLAKKKKKTTEPIAIVSEQPPRLEVTLGHMKQVSAVDISSDEELLLSGGNDSIQAHLWHLASGRELCRTGLNELGEVKAVGFLPKNKYFVVAGRVGSGWPVRNLMRIYKTSDCSIEKQLPYAANRVDFSPDGELMLIISRNAGAIVLKTDNWQELDRFHVSKELFGPLGKDGGWQWKIQQGRFVGESKQILLTARHKLSLVSLENPMRYVWSVSIPEKYETSYGSEVRNDFMNLQVDQAHGIISALARDGYLYRFSLHDGEKIKRIKIGEHQTSALEFLSNGNVVTGSMRLSSYPSLDVLNVWGAKGKSSNQELTWEKDESSIANIISIISRNDKLYAVQENGRVTVVDAVNKLKKQRSYRLTGKLGPVYSVSFSPNGHQMLLGLSSSAVEGVASLIDLQSAKEQRILGTLMKGYDARRGPFGDSPEFVLHTLAVFAGDNSIVTANKRSLQVVDTRKKTQNVLSQWGAVMVAPPRLAVSEDHSILLHSFGFQLKKYNLNANNVVDELKWKFQGDFMIGRSAIKGIAFSKDGKNAVSISDSNQSFALWDVKKSRLLREFGKKEPEVTAVVFSKDEQSIFASSVDRSISQWDIHTGQRLFSFLASFEPITSMHFIGDDKLVTGSRDGSIRVWDTKKGVELERYQGKSGGVNDIAISKDYKFILGAYDDGSAILWKVGVEQWVAKYTSFRDGTWAVVTPDGRYDSNHPGDLPALSWIMSDDVLTPLPIEIFMKDYYEPRLLARILAGEKFPALKSLADINRVQPKVNITSIEKVGKQGLVDVSVEVARSSKTYQRAGKSVRVVTGVYDLKLFRDGQLVAYAPQQSGKITLDKNGKAKVKFSNIKLPTNKGDEIEFTAYAFNVDGVKSATSKKNYTISGKIPPRTPRAYVFSIGVNTYQNSAWNLLYAANDAASMQTVITEKLKQSGRFDATNIVSIPLISKYGSEMEATKAKVKAVFDLLAGKKVPSELIASIPNADKIKPANPEDFLLISYSGHGYADEKREFYLFPYDIGTGDQRSVKPEVLKHLVSSEELSLWLRDVDAGEMTMIVDACNSAASVQGSGFKPGPMGSRGLGQLAYDKGMRILAASQAESVALESSLILHGVLTYSLVQEGLSQHLADNLPQDKKILLGEWLKYGVTRVPELNQEIKAGAISTSRGLDVEVHAGESDKKLSVYDQQPSLFDFNKHRNDSLLMEVQ